MGTRRSRLSPNGYRTPPMIQAANRAREALDHLAQDLGHFNLENYRNLEGRYTLAELGEWVRRTILKLGGGAIPAGDFWTFICPEALQRKCRLLPSVRPNVLRSTVSSPDARMRT